MLDMNPQPPLRAREFIPGFSFELKTSMEPEVWERISIHTNCAEELIAEVVKTFRRQPEFFRRLE